MNKILNIKKHKNMKLYKLSFSFGVITIFIEFVWLVMHLTGVASINEDFNRLITDVARHIGLGSLFFVTVSIIFFLVINIIEIKNIKKKNLKYNQLNILINCLVFILSICISILTLIKGLNQWEWFGTSIYSTFTYMGILTSLMVYIAIYGFQFVSYKWLSKSKNNKTTSNFLIFIVVMSALNILPLVMTLIGGFINIDKIDTLIYTKEFHLWAASAYCSKFLLVFLGTTSFSILIISIISYINNYDKKWSWLITSIATLIIFIVLVVLLFPRDKVPYWWVIKHKNLAITPLMLICWLGCVVVSILAVKQIIKNKKSSK